MANSSKQKTNQPRKKPWRYLRDNPKKLISLIILAIVIFLPLALWANSIHQQRIRNQEIANQKNQVSHSEEDMDKIVADISSDIRKSDKQSKIKGCDYTSGFGFEKGDLVCSINFALNFRVETRSEAITLSQDLSNAIKDSQSFQLTGVSIALAGTIPPEQLLAESYKDALTNLPCQADYTYYANQMSIKPIPLKATEDGPSLLISFSCTLRPSASNLF